MNSAMKSALCPSCGKEVIKPETISGETPWPFCSEKCRDSDLYGWLSEDYKISRDLDEEEFDDWARKKFGKLDPYDPDAF